MKYIYGRCELGHQAGLWSAEMMEEWLEGETAMIWSELSLSLSEITM